MMSENKIKSQNSRRNFLAGTSALIGSTFAAPALVRGRNLNERIRIALVGMGGRAQAHCQSLLEIEQEGQIPMELAGVCDCDAKKLKTAINVWTDKFGHSLQAYSDLRQVLDDPGIDAISYATPNHWHALGVVWGCQAGKDVYVEKPGSHNIAEGRAMVNAARQHNKIVQHGTQCRSSPNIVEGIRLLHEGIIGEVYFARGIAYKIRGSLGQHAPATVPDGLDWNAWCGPAAVKEFSNFHHRRWHWVWEFGNGEIGNQGVHQFDILRWGMKLDTHPETVSAVGSNYMQEKVHQSSAETPGILSATMKWPDGKLLEFEVRDWYTNAEAGFRDRYPFVQKNFPVGAIFLGTKGTMIIPDYSSYRVFLGPNQEPGPFKYEEGSPMSETEHFRNWLRAVQSRNPADLSAEILEGHMSSALCHLANISYRVDHTIHFDGEAENFGADDEANSLLSRPERSPFTASGQA